jgi:hypothetical protein
MASRTRVPTRTIEDILAGAIDVIDRADRLLGKVDLIRYMGILCGPANPIDTQIIVGGVPVDPRARTWVLNQLTDSVQTAPILGAVWDVSDRWARQLGQVDLARVLGVALTAANPVVSGIFDTLGNRMPSMDNVARPGFIDEIDRAARLVGIIYGNVGQVQQRAGSLDLYVQLRTAGAEYDARQIRALVLTDVLGVVDAAGNRLPSMDVVGRKGFVQLTDGVSAVDVASITAAGATKVHERVASVHDAKVYQFTAGGSAVDGATVIDAVANKVIKIHRIFLQSTEDAATDVYLYEETSGNLVTTKTTLNAREGRESAFVFAPACIGQTTTVNKKVLLKNAATKQLNWEITYSADDAT